MPITDAQISLLLETLQNIERHLATLASTDRENARLRAQAALSPAR